MATNSLCHYGLNDEASGLEGYRGGEERAENRTAWQGRPSLDEQIPSLGRALAQVPRESGLHSTAGFRVVVEGRQRSLKAGLQRDVYRIGREAILNAVLHSDAESIETEIEYRLNELRIAVRDNGCGIDTEKLRWARNGQWGLQGMRERAEQIGARLRISSRAAMGTEVVLCVPGRIAFEQS